MNLSEFKKNALGVPQYPKGHAGRLFVVAAAVSTLERPTSSSVAALTGISKGNMDQMILIDLPSQLGVKTAKVDAVYQIISWGGLVMQNNVKRCLVTPVNEPDVIK